MCKIPGRRLPSSGAPRIAKTRTLPPSSRSDVNRNFSNVAPSSSHFFSEVTSRSGDSGLKSRHSFSGVSKTSACTTAADGTSSRPTRINSRWKQRFSRTALLKDDHRMHVQSRDDDLDCPVCADQRKRAILGLERRFCDPGDSATDSDIAQRNHLFADRPRAPQLRLIGKSPRLLQLFRQGRELLIDRMATVRALIVEQVHDDSPFLRLPAKSRG